MNQGSAVRCEMYDRHLYRYRHGRRATVRKRKGRAGTATPSAFRCTPSIDRCTVYRSGPTWGRPVARRRQREISLSQMQTTAPCSGRREEGTSGFALQVLISGIDTCTPNTEAWTGQHCMRHTHHRQHHQQRHEEALQTRLSLPGPVHSIGDGRWLAPPQHACASERHQDSVDPV